MPAALAQSLNELGVIALSQEEYAHARTLVVEGLTTWRELGDKAGIAGSLGLLGVAAFMQGDYTSARRLEEEALTIYRELGNKSNIARWLYNLGHIAHREGDAKRARELYIESLIVSQELGSKRTIGRCLMALGGVAGTTKQPLRGAMLLGAAEALFNSISSMLQPDDQAEHDRAIVSTLSQLNQETFDAAWAEGQALTLEQAIGLALIEIPEPEIAPSFPSTQSYPNDLTSREVEVLRLVAQGLSSAQIAKHLFLSRNTVHAHLRSVYSKIGVSSRTAAAHYAVEHGLI